MHLISNEAQIPNGNDVGNDTELVLSQMSPTDETRPFTCIPSGASTLPLNRRERITTNQSVETGSMPRQVNGTLPNRRDDNPVTMFRRFENSSTSTENEALFGNTTPILNNVAQSSVPVASVNIDSVHVETGSNIPIPFMDRLLGMFILVAL